MTTDASDVSEAISTEKEEEKNEKEQADIRKSLDSVTLSGHRRAPFLLQQDSVRSIMIDVIVALIPSLLWGIYVFGLRVLTLAFCAIVSCVVFDAISAALFRRTLPASDLSAVVTGLVFTFLCPVTLPLWAVPFGAFFAIVVVKQLFGGLGKNPVNPALAAYALLLRSFPVLFSVIPEAFVRPAPLSVAPELPEQSVTSFLTSLRGGLIPDFSLVDLFFGVCPGMIGEISSLLLIGGGLYLLARRVITWHIPASMLGTVALLTFAFPLTTLSSDETSLRFMAFELLSGSLLLIAIFAATDPVTTPVHPVGKLLFGLGCGLLTVLFRYFGSDPDGAVFAVLLMNLASPLLDRITTPRPFGELGAKREAEPEKEGETHETD